MRTTLNFSVILFGIITGLACASAPDTRAEQNTLETEARSTLDAMQSKDPSLASVLDSAHAYAVFPTISEGALIAGVTSGVGVVYDASGNIVANVEVQGGSIGAQIGGQAYSQLIIFRTDAALTDFSRDDFEFSADASATALTAGASVRQSFENGVAVVVDAESGLMAEASLGGQSYSYQAL